MEVGTESNEGANCPYCSRELGAIDFDTSMCECGAFFKIRGETLEFEGGEQVDV